MMENIFSSGEREALNNYEFVTIGAKRYGKCRDCSSVIRVNKPVLGSSHICLSIEELHAKHARLQHAASMQKIGIPKLGELGDFEYRPQQIK